MNRLPLLSLLRALASQLAWIPQGVGTIKSFCKRETGETKQSRHKTHNLPPVLFLQRRGDFGDAAAAYHCRPSPSPPPFSGPRLALAASKKKLAKPPSSFPWPVPVHFFFPSRFLCSGPRVRNQALGVSPAILSSAHRLGSRCPRPLARAQPACTLLHTRANIPDCTARLPQRLPRRQQHRRLAASLRQPATITVSLFLLSCFSFSRTARCRPSPRALASRSALRAFDSTPHPLLCPRHGLIWGPAARAEAYDRLQSVTRLLFSCREDTLHLFALVSPLASCRAALAPITTASPTLRPTLIPGSGCTAASLLIFLPCRPVRSHAVVSLFPSFFFSIFLPATVSARPQSPTCTCSLSCACAPTSLPFFHFFFLPGQFFFL